MFQKHSGTLLLNVYFVNFQVKVQITGTFGTKHHQVCVINPVFM